MADMHDPCGQDSDSSTESASDTEINNAEEDNTIINKNGKTLVKSKTFDFLTVDFGPDNDDNNMPGTPVNKGKKKKKKANLQESFMKFKKEKQKEILRKRRLKELRKRHRSDPGHADRLRQKFVNQAKKYFGVPYARKYWPPESLEYKSPLFLDCCALVRQAVRDLEDDFGFRIGPWNQAYMFDTLPNKIEHERDMRPGDLVFMSGVYHKKKRQQKHHMTHVEIWAGDGNKTIGARWNNGKVQVFDSYRFDAKSFHSTEYHFRSIDTWLHGTCKSFCPQHRWKRSKYAPKKKSVFHVEVQNQVIEQEQDEAAGDSSDNESPDSRPDTALSRDTPLPPKSNMSSMTSVNAESLLVVQKCEPQTREKLFEIGKTYASDKNLKDFKVSISDSIKLEPKTSDKFLDLDVLGSTLEETSKSYPLLAKKGSKDSSSPSIYKMNGQTSESKSQRQDRNQDYDVCRSAEPSPDFAAYLDDDYLDEKDIKSGSESGMPRSKTEISFYSKEDVEDTICKDLIRPSSALSSSGAD